LQDWVQDSPWDFVPLQPKLCVVEAAGIAQIFLQLLLVEKSHSPLLSALQLAPQSTEMVPV
jgi:hypothetical protein